VRVVGGEEKYWLTQNNWTQLLHNTSSPKYCTPLRTHDSCMKDVAEHIKIARSAHTVYLCVLCGFENKQRLFHCTALTNWFL
jgi:hypothetical protein